MQTPVTSCHLLSTWHEWNANTGDVIMTWFASYANLVTSCWACAYHACMHGTHAIIRMGASKYSNGLTGMPANLNLGRLTTSHFKAPITKIDKHVPIGVSQ